MKRHILVFLFLMMLMETHATTWFPSQVKCPVCQEKNEFFVIGSYGGYYISMAFQIPIYFLATHR